jgi:hypothetical protein
MKNLFNALQCEEGVTTSSDSVSLPVLLIIGNSHVHRFDENKCSTQNHKSYVTSEQIYPGSKDCIKQDTKDISTTNVVVLHTADNALSKMSAQMTVSEKWKILFHCAEKDSWRLRSVWLMQCLELVCQGSHAPWKTWNILEKKVLPGEPWNVLGLINFKLLEYPGI